MSIKTVCKWATITLLLGLLVACSDSNNNSNNDNSGATEEKVSFTELSRGWFDQNENDEPPSAEDIDFDFDADEDPDAFNDLLTSMNSGVEQEN
ncbi:MAG: hypothetical protein COB30_000865 [Ectothiorhodospiraceae bacterium]|nr:hypothetical protein [Ectothiorhodospiraceae bacterium]